MAQAILVRAMHKGVGASFVRVRARDKVRASCANRHLRRSPRFSTPIASVFSVSDDRSSHVTPDDGQPVRAADERRGPEDDAAASPGAAPDSVGSTAPPAAVGPHVDSQQTVISKRPPVSPPAFRRAANPFEMGQSLEGEKLGHFQLEEFVGGGGMGAVFRATDTMLGRTVAVKVVSRDADQ